MAAATLCPQMTAATQHALEVLRLQSTAIAANVVFINIDWKASRHNTGRLEANMELLGKTIASVVRNMNPKMICMCEVGVASYPLTEEQMKQVRDQSMHAWQAAATGDFELRSMFQVGAPYMTIYIDGSVRCSRHRILTGLYCAQGKPRTAQTFLCCGPGGVTVDVINVHAPSGKKKLTDQQRKTLLTNLLQTNSESMPGRLIGSARFLIGGDMNTLPLSMSHLLQVCRGNGSLHTPAHIHHPALGMHGDLCFLGGFKADSLTTTADNHDRQHKPYGICWSMAQGLALTTIPTQREYGPSDQCLEHKTYDPECQLCTTYTAWEGEQDQLWAPQCSFTYSPTRPVFTPSASQGRAPIFFPTNCATQWRSTIASDTAADAVPAVADAAPQTIAATEPAPGPTIAATEPSLAAESDDEQVAGEVLDSHQPGSPSTAKSDGAAMAAPWKPWWQSWKPWTWRQSWKPWSEPDSETVADAATAATDEEEPPSVRKQRLGELLFTKVTLLQLSADGSTPELASQEVPADKMMIYSIVNEFLGMITFSNSVAEEMLIAALMDESCLSPSVHLRVEKVFSRIFFYYANGVNDRSGWQPQDTSKYIRQWSELASMRTWVNSGFAASTEHGEQLSKDQVSQIFKWYMEDMKTTLREDQLDKPWVYYKSCAEAKMKHQAGHTFVAKAIWAIGLPRLPSFATEQRGKQLSAQDLEAVPEAIDSVLNWLDRLASTLTTHHETNEYKTAVRKSGVAHRQSGLNVTEQKTRRATRKAKFDIRTARDLDSRWKDRTQTFQNWVPWQEDLLRAYWNGLLERRLKEAQESRGIADPMCRTPLQPLRL